MITNKNINKIITVIMAAAVAVCLLACVFSNRIADMLGGKGVKVEYETALFDTSQVMTVDILMDEDSWNEMLDNAIAEEYYLCDVVINGEKIRNVGIRPKGNTSLSAIAMDPDTDRFSLKLEFDYYVEGQTCFGLDKLILNNNYADATNMKEALIYDMFRYLGADASLYNYAEISVNGEYWGVYLALEAVEDSFMLRNYGTQDGELYKPESLGMGGGDKGGFSFGDMDFSSMDFSNFDFSNMPAQGGGGFSFQGGSSPSDSQMQNMPQGGNMPSDMPQGGNMPSGFGNESFSAEDFSSFDMSDFSFSSSSGGGANLNYIDDELDSYSTIWEGEITRTGKSDHKKVVEALKNISTGTDLEKYLDVDNVLKYMAAHVFAVNMDSLSGSMAHNYYLYENDGQLNMIPWDYNLSFGGMSMGGSGDATSMVNDAIDTPFSGTKFFNALLENEEYLERYHEYLRQLTDEYVGSGRFDEVFNRITGQIDQLVETDPNALYSYEEYETAKEYLYETIQLRAESIRGQIDGTIPSTDAGQNADRSALIDASHIDVEAMGQFSMGGAGGGGGFSFGGNSSNTDSDASSRIPSWNAQGGMQMPSDAWAGGNSSSSKGERPQGGMNMPSFGNGDGASMEIPSGMVDISSMSGTGSILSKVKVLAGYAVCLAAMLAALLALKLYKRR